MGLTPFQSLLEDTGMCAYSLFIFKIVFDKVTLHIEAYVTPNVVKINRE